MASTTAKPETGSTCATNLDEKSTTNAKNIHTAVDDTMGPETVGPDETAVLEKENEPPSCEKQGSCAEVSASGASSAFLTGHVFCMTSMGRGHGIPMIQLARVVADLSETAHMSIVWPILEEDVASVEAKMHIYAGPQISIHLLPLPEVTFEANSSPEFFESHLRPLVERAVAAHGPIGVCVVDFFYSQTLNLKRVTQGAPVWMYFTSPLPCCYTLFRFRWSRTRIPEDFVMPCYGNVRGRDLPSSSKMFDLEQCALNIINDQRHLEGMLFNDSASWYDAETLDFVCGMLPPAWDEEVTGVSRVPNWRHLMIGPLVTVDPRECALGWSAEDRELCAWLDTQRPRSVTYVALGSCFVLPYEACIELAWGLAAVAGQVLWAHRRPNLAFVAVMNQGREKPADYDDATGLPRDFAAPNIRRETWVNQICVLRHPALACFLTHCGWNSTVEGLVVGGVPLVCLPIGAEQSTNATFVCDYLKVGRRIWHGPEQDSLHRARVTELVQSVSADSQMRARAAAIAANARRSTTHPDGASRKDLLHFVRNYVDPEVDPEVDPKVHPASPPKAEGKPAGGKAAGGKVSAENTIRSAECNTGSTPLLATP